MVIIVEYNHEKHLTEIIEQQKQNKMEEKKLTPQIAAMYWGAEVMYLNGAISTVDGKFLFDATPSLYKLRLYPLSEITDEDVEIVMEGIQCSFDYVKSAITANDWQMLFEYHIGQSVIIRTVDTLRALGYDCGFGSLKSLISAGIALKKDR